jgi:hypothetical protein
MRPLQTYARLASLAQTFGIDKTKFLNLLLVPNAPKDGAYNLGNAVSLSFSPIQPTQLTRVAR